MATKKNVRASSYPMIEDFIRFIAERTDHAQGLSVEKRVQGALEGLFGDWEKALDHRRLKRTRYTRDLMAISGLMAEGKAANAREATRLYFGKNLEKKAKSENITCDGLLRRYSNIINKDPKKYLKPDTYDLLFSMYGGIPEAPMFAEGALIAEWLIINEKLLNFCVSNIKKKRR